MCCIPPRLLRRTAFCTFRKSERFRLSSRIFPAVPISNPIFFSPLTGTGKLVYDGKEYALNSGDCAFIDCRKEYSHTTRDDFWSLRWCHFYGPTLSFVYEKYAQRGGKPAFHPNDGMPFRNVLDSLYLLANSADYIRDMRINEELNKLCTLLMEQSWHPETGISAPKRTSVADVKAYLDEDYATRITLDALSGKFFINKYYLTRVFKEQYGVSINTYLQNLRIPHAKQLLRFSAKTVEEIGLECGLGQLHYFSRVFKEVEGVPPSVYRNQW